MIAPSGLLVLLQAGADVVGPHTSHGSVPRTLLGSLVMAVAVAVVLFVFALCVKYFLRPGETSPAHIKRRILE